MSPCISLYRPRDQTDLATEEEGGDGRVMRTNDDGRRHGDSLSLSLIVHRSLPCDIKERTERRGKGEL